jgi:predicted transcriptional regulator
MVDNTVFYVGLKPRDIAVYCFLCRMENREKGYAFPTRRHIARACGISKVETVDLALKELVRRGFIEKTHSYSEEHGYEANHYKIIKIDYDNLPI